MTRPTTKPPTPDELYESDEREAIQQESCGKKIEVVRRNVRTGELIEPEQGGER